MTFFKDALYKIEVDTMMYKYSQFLDKSSILDIPSGLIADMKIKTSLGLGTHSVFKDIFEFIRKIIILRNMPPSIEVSQ